MYGEVGYGAVYGNVIRVRRGRLRNSLRERNTCTERSATEQFTGM